MHVVADLTKANPGTELSVLERIPNLQISGNIIEAVIYPRQKINLSSVSSLQFTEIAEGGDLGKQVAERITHLLANNNESITVLSFNGYVLNLATKIDPAIMHRVSFLPWSSAWRVGNTSQGKISSNKYQDASWPLNNISENETMEVLIKALRERRAFNESTSIRKTAIRPLLAKIEPRLDKPNTDHISGFISKLVSIAEHKGLITTINPGLNPSIWLNQSIATPAIAVIPNTEKIKKGDLFSEKLKQDGMGPFPNFRDELFDAMDELVNSDSKPTLTHLIHNSVGKVQLANENEHNGFHWGAVKHFIRSLLMLQDVALDEFGNPFRPNFLNMSKTVHALAKDWRIRLDGELILHLLRSGCEIGINDFQELIGSIYKTREEQYEDKLNAVIGHLNAVGKIICDETTDSLKLAS